MNAEKRLNKGYKVKDVFYQKARKRAAKEHGSLVNLIECVVIAYSYGMNIVAQNGESKGGFVSLEEVVATHKLKDKKQLSKSKK